MVKKQQKAERTGNHIWLRNTHCFCASVGGVVVGVESTHKHVSLPPAAAPLCLVWGKNRGLIDHLLHRGVSRLPFSGHRETQWSREAKCRKQNKRLEVGWKHTRDENVGENKYKGKRYWNRKGKRSGKTSGQESLTLQKEAKKKRKEKTQQMTSPIVKIEKLSSGRP